MSSKEVPLEQARKKLGDLVNAALLAGTTTIITRNGRPTARIAPLEDTVTITADAAVTALVSEGHDRADVVAAIDSLINAGLDLEQPDDGTILSYGELDVLREQLAS
jgi:prevent-host-death family protein